MTKQFPIRYSDGELTVDGVSVRSLAEKVDTPFFLYSQAAILGQIRRWKMALGGLPARVFYAVKANDNLHLLRLFAASGFGADIVSGGELFLARKAGIPGKDILFAGVGKKEVEMEMALREQILAFNVESPAEFYRLNQLGKRLGVKVPVHFRVNPDIDPKSHPYISTGLKKNKFGMDPGTVLNLYRQSRGMSFVEAHGVHVHIGSQITSLEPFRLCGQWVRQFVQEIRRQGGIVQSVDVGGGLGVDYHGVLPWPPPEREMENVVTPEDYIEEIVSHLRDLNVQLFFEPGRALIANSGILVTRVEYVKRTGSRTFLIVDAGMNDLIRPCLYQAYHRILPVVDPERSEREIVDIVGPVCESSDFLALERPFPVVQEGEILAVFSAGAYASVLGSNYNGRLRPAEYLISDGQVRLIRRAETHEDLLRRYEGIKF